MTWGHLRSLLGSCWGVLVPFLDVLEGSWRHLGVILGYLGGSWEGLEASWRGFGSNLWIFWIRYGETHVASLFWHIFLFFVACFLFVKPSFLSLLSRFLKDFSMFAFLNASIATH